MVMSLQQRFKRIWANDTKILEMLFEMRRIPLLKSFLMCDRQKIDLLIHKTQLRENKNIFSVYYDL